MVANPEKELRFTRARQARVFFVIGSICTASICAGLFGGLMPRPYGAPELQSYWPILIPLSIIGILCFKIGFHCLKHAYLILTPLGVEIFPFRKPEQNLRVIYWSEIDSLELKNENLFIHYNKKKTAGAVVSLKPINKNLHPMLDKVVQDRAK